MNLRFESPRSSDLSGLPIYVDTSGDPGVTSVTAWANDQSEVRMTWDEVAQSVTVTSEAGGRQALRIDREGVSRVSVTEPSAGIVEFRVWSGSGDVSGVLSIQVGEHLTLQDTLLRA